jgi:hypothetical protein
MFDANVTSIVPAGKVDALERDIHQSKPFEKDATGSEAANIFRAAKASGDWTLVGGEVQLIRMYRSIIPGVYH